MSFLHDLPIADLIAQYGYLAIFVIITLESAGVPLPGETILISSAVYAGSTGNLNIALIVAAAASAAILGDNLGYWVGRRWGMPLLLRYGHLIALDARRFMLFNGLGGVAWASIMGFGAYLCGRQIEHVVGPVGLALLAVVIFGGLALWLFVKRHEERLLLKAEAAIPGPLS